MNNTDDSGCIRVAANCINCRNDYNVRIPAICEKCLVSEIKPDQDFWNKRKHVTWRGSAFIALFCAPVFYAMYHYYGPKAEAIVVAAFIFGQNINAIATWLAKKI